MRQYLLIWLALRMFFVNGYLKCAIRVLHIIRIVAPAVFHQVA